MTYQYACLAIGRKKELRDVRYIVPCDAVGNELPYLSDDDAWLRYGTEKVITYEIKDGGMYCYLDVKP